MVQTATAQEVDVKTVTHKPMVEDRFLFIFLWNCTKRFQMDSEFMDTAVFVVMKQFSSGANKRLRVGLSSVLEWVICFFFLR